MKPIVMLLTAAVAAICFAGSPATPAPTTAPAVSLRCRIAVPERGVVQLGPGHAPLHVVLENVSDAPLAIADEWNSWGYYTLTLRYTTAAGTAGTIEKVGRIWTRNFLTTTPLPPGGLLVRDVAFDPAVWTGLPGNGVVEVTAIFEQEIHDAADHQGPPPWAGTAESPAVKVEVR